MDSFFNRNLCGRFGHWENPEGIRIADFMYGSSPKLRLFYPTQPRATAPPSLPSPPIRCRAALEAEKGKSLTRQQQDGTRTVIVIEGFLLFFFPQVASACHHRIMFRCSEAVSCRRRLQRTFPKDLAEATDDETDQFTAWYHNTVWKHFVK